MIRFVALLAVMSPAATIAETISFGTGENAFEIEFVTIGDVGNPPDERTFYKLGSVDYEYGIAKYEAACHMGIAPYLNGVFGDDYFILCSNPNHPWFGSWPEAAEFVNWLNTSSGYPPAYKINNNYGSGSVEFRLTILGPGDPGFNPQNPTRNALARFALTSADEFHKAAFFDPVEGVYRNYATGDETPTNVGPEGSTEPNTILYLGFGYVDVTMAGGLSAYGTMGQSGNATEWEETRLALQDDLLSGRASRTGRIDSNDIRDFQAARSRIYSLSYRAGVRVVSIPQPASLNCNGDGIVSAADLTCSNQAGFTPQLISELGLIHGDLNAEGGVDFVDFEILSANFGEQLGSYTDGDINSDGKVAFDDFLIMSATFGMGGGAASVPEPSAQFLLLLGLVPIFKRDRS